MGSRHQGCILSVLARQGAADRSVVQAAAMPSLAVSVCILKVRLCCALPILLPHSLPAGSTTQCVNFRTKSGWKAVQSLCCLHLCRLHRELQAAVKPGLQLRAPAREQSLRRRMARKLTALSRNRAQPRSPGQGRDHVRSDCHDRNEEAKQGDNAQHVQRHYTV